MYGKYRSTGSGVAIEVDPNKNLYVQACGGKYSEAAIAGRLFVVANQAAVATTAGLATTWTGLGIANPTGSGKIVVVHQFSYALSLAGSTAGVVGLMSTTDSGFAADIATRNAKFGGPAGSVLADGGATIATPVLERVFGSYGTAATTAFQALGPFVHDLEGSCVLVPGRAVCTYTTLATTAAFVFSFMWEELDA